LYRNASNVVDKEYKDILIPLIDDGNKKNIAKL
jgi:hypothetical protein